MHGSQVNLLRQNGATPGASLYTVPTNGISYLHRVHLASVGLSASGNLQVNGTPADGNTFTINAGGSLVYTFKTALTPTAGEVLIGGSATAAAANLFAALTGGAGSGTTYAAGTTPLDATLVSVSGPVAGVITITAVAPGTAANSYTLAKSGTNLAVSGATLSGGTAATQSNAWVYDNASAASGTLLAALACVAGTNDFTDYGGGVTFTKGLYVIVNGTGAQLLVTME